MTPELKVRIACGGCNNVRLKDIEDRSIPVLKPMIIGRPRSLNEIRQFIVA